MAEPLISVIIAARDAGHILSRAIESALKQSWCNIELIVVDDASTDDTGKVVASFDDPRLILLHNDENRHISVSTNRGMAAAHGDFIAILDSDDAWYPDKLKQQMAWMEAHPETGACFTWVNVVDENGHPWSAEQEGLVTVFRQNNRSRTQWLHDLLLSGNCLCHPSVLYRRSVLEACGWYDPSLAQLLDYEIYLRLLQHADIHILREPLMDYCRKQQENTSNSAVTGEAHYRAMNEMAIVVCDYIFHMPPELFAEVFAGELTVTPFDPELADFEKGQLLYHCFSDETIRRFGLMMVRGCLRVRDRRKELREKTGVGPFEFFRWLSFEDSDSHITRLTVRQESLRGVLAINKAYFGGKLAARTRRLRIVLRKAVNAVKGRLRRYERFYMFLGAAKRTVTVGPREAVRQFRETQRIRNAKIAAWPSEETAAAQRAARFSRDIVFSVLVPLYNTPEKYLREMIESVLAQTYGGFELCLIDGSDDAHGYVGAVCAEYAEKEPRVKYRKLPENLGFSGNTNAGIALSGGEYLCLLDHDDLLHPSALYEVMEAVCGQGADFVYTDEAHFRETPDDACLPHFKPNFSPDTLRSYNYICHLSVFSRSLLEAAGGGFRKEYDGSQDYDLILRLTEKAHKIVHIPHILYLWRTHTGSTASDVAVKDYALDAARRALAAHLRRVGLRGEVTDGRIPSTYDIRYELREEPLVSILIPNRDHADDLKRCVDSIRAKSTYPEWEIVIIENNSSQDATFRYYEELKTDRRIRVTTYTGEFNFSAVNNFGARAARGKYLLLLNNDTEVITPDWIERMLMFAQREDVGAVGCMLYYPDDTVQHGGVILGIGGVAGHAHKYFKRGEPGFMYRMAVAQNLSAVTAACMMIPRDVWDGLNGLDENLAIAFNDVDLCMRIRQSGALIVWTPFAELYHFESRSRGKEDSLDKQQRFAREIAYFQKRWGQELAAGDPYYNPNLSLKKEDFSLR